MDIYKLETEIAKFIYELQTEDRLVRVGLKDKSESAKVYQKYSDLFGMSTIDFLKGQREVFAKREKERDAKKRDILARFYFTIVGSFIGLKLAKGSDKITTYFSGAKVKIGGEEIAYFQVAPKIAKENIFEKREQYDKAAVGTVVKINPAQLAVLKSEIQLLKSLGFESYISYFSQAQKMDYANFDKTVERIKKDTDKLWEKVIARVSVDIFKRPFKKIPACHLLYLRSLSMFDNFYPKEKVVSTFKTFAQGLGFSDLLSQIEIDDKDRPRKNPRAVCYWPNPPKEVHLVIKPIGGEQDFEAMFHEGGHAFHGASISSDLAFAYKNLSRSNALTETYAFVLESMVFEPAWLSRYLNVSSHTAEKIQWQAYFSDLMMLRRYLGKFSYEYEMFSGLVRGRSLREGPVLYKRNLDAATGFIHRKENWLSDMDSGFYSSNYLRAWIGASQIKDYLTRKFGKRWFINKKAGAFLRKLFARGVTDELEDVVRRLGYKPWDVSFLMKEYRRVLD